MDFLNQTIKTGNKNIEGKEPNQLINVKLFAIIDMKLLILDVGSIQ